MADAETYDVFISCPGKRGAVLSAVVSSMTARLEEAGLRCWSAQRDLEADAAGGAARDESAAALEASRVLVQLRDGKKCDGSDEADWQGQLAIAHGLTVVPFSMKRLTSGDDWLEELDLVLEEELTSLVRKLELLLEGERDEVEGEAGPVEDPAEPLEKEVSTGSGGNDRDGKVSFPLPPPKVNVAGPSPEVAGKSSRTRRTGDETGRSGRAEVRRSKAQWSQQSELEALSGYGEHLKGTAPGTTEPVRRTQPPKPRRRTVQAAMVIILVVAALLGLQAMLSRSPVSADERNLRELELLGFSLNMFASENEGRLPDDLEQLKGMRSDGSALRWRNYEDHTEKEFLYFPGYTWDYDPAVVVAAAPSADKDDYRAVLYLNAEVRRLPESFFRRRLEEGSIGPAAALSAAE